MITVADTFHAEVGSVRDAITSFENTVETYLTDDLDQQYAALGGAHAAIHDLREMAEGFAEVLRERIGELENDDSL